MSQPSAVSIRDWGWRHATRKDFTLRHLNLEISPGERVMILGSSGAGKSTLLGGIAGVLGGSDEGEQEGSISIDGVVAGEQTRGRVGLVLQDPDAQVMLERVGDDVAFGLENLNIPPQNIWPIVRQSLDMVGLEHIELDHSTGALSGGQRQRLALAGVLAMQPGVLVLDEPTANLDPDGVVQVKQAVSHVLERTGATLIVVEHHIDVWLDMIQRVIVLGSHHEVLADGAPEAVFSQYGQELAQAGAWVPGQAVPTQWRAKQDSPVETETLGDDCHKQSERNHDGNEEHQGREILLTDQLSFGRDPAQALGTGVNLTLATGQIYAIMGPNGAGKSTLALTLAGLLKPCAGHIYWHGKALQERESLWSKLTAHSAHAVHKRYALAHQADPYYWSSKSLLGRIGMVFQEPEHQFVTAKVVDEVALSAKLQGVAEEEAHHQAMQLLATLHLDRWALANPHTLSGGEKRRLSVASMLMSAPELLIMDEPTFGQDYQTWCHMVELIAQIRDTYQTVVVMVTHDEALVEALGAKVIMLSPSDAQQVTQQAQQVGQVTQESATPRDAQ